MRVLLRDVQMAMTKQEPPAPPPPTKGRGRQPPAWFQGVERLDDLSCLYENAATLAPRLKYNDSLLEYLFRYSKLPLLSRSEWTNEIVISRCIDLIYDCYFRNISIDELRSICDKYHISEKITNLRKKNGVLFLSFHGGYPMLARRLFNELFSNTIELTRAGLGRFSARDDARGILFAALKEIRAGGNVWVAPDGPLGASTSSVQLLGLSTMIADGAAFLAYETRCPTAWFTMSRNERGFFPVAEIGPSATAGESYDDFRHRIHSFYAEQIELSFTGDPRGICLAGRWVQRLMNAINN
jgi:hypothetical protein